MSEESTEKVFAEDVHIWPIGAGDWGLFRIDRPEDASVPWKLDITSLRTFNSREEAVLYAESLGRSFTARTRTEMNDETAGVLVDSGGEIGYNRSMDTEKLNSETGRVLRPGDRIDPKKTWIIDHGLSSWWISRPKIHGDHEEVSYSSVCKFETLEEAVLYAESLGCDFRVADFEVDLDHLRCGFAEKFNPSWGRIYK